MERERRFLPLLLAVMLMALLASCVKPLTDCPGGCPEETAAPAEVAAPAPAPTPAPAPAPAPEPPAPPVPTDPYDLQPEKLTTTQCGQCHTSYFLALQKEGGKHRFDCANCHEQFHAYNPNRNNWAEIMPKCASCHTLPHGPNQTECLACHSNPHKPVGVALSERVVQNCGSCHAGPANELQQLPSKHTLQGCVACHSDHHGNIPSCFVCHQGHYADQPLESCTTCHPVHKPLQIAFKGEVELKTCSGCHANVYSVWAGSKSKHAQVSCVSCHEQHGQIPNCSQCHGAAPHNQSLHAKFPNCLTCHLDPHDPPVKTK